MLTVDTFAARNRAASKRTRLRVLLLTDSPNAADLLAGLTRILGDEPLTRSVSTPGEMLEAAGQDEWDVMIAHWHQLAPEAGRVQEVARSLRGEIRLIEIEADGGHTTVTAARTMPRDAADHADWLIFAAHNLLRRSRERAETRGFAVVPRAAGHRRPSCAR